jgi:hypothetical protein
MVVLVKPFDETLWFYIVCHINTWTMFLTRYLTSLKDYYTHANIGINFDLKLPYSDNVSLRFFFNSCVHDDVVACMLLLLCSHCMGFWILSFRFILKLLTWNNIFLLHGSSLSFFFFFFSLGTIINHNTMHKRF